MTATFLRSYRWLAQDQRTGAYFHAIAAPPIGVQWTPDLYRAHTTLNETTFRDRVIPALRDHGVDPETLRLHRVLFVRPAACQAPWRPAP